MPHFLQKKSEGEMTHINKTAFRLSIYSTYPGQLTIKMCALGSQGHGGGMEEAVTVRGDVPESPLI